MTQDKAQAEVPPALPLVLLSLRGGSLSLEGYLSSVDGTLESHAKILLSARPVVALPQPPACLLAGNGSP